MFSALAVGDTVSQGLSHLLVWRRGRSVQGRTVSADCATTQDGGATVISKNTEGDLKIAPSRTCCLEVKDGMSSTVFRKDILRWSLLRP